MGDATQVGLARTAFLVWAMQHRWIRCLMRVRLPYPRTLLVLWSSHVTALFWCAKIDLLLFLFERRDVSFFSTQRRHVRDSLTRVTFGSEGTKQCLRQAPAEKGLYDTL